MIYGRIKPGAKVFQDFRFTVWPHVKRPNYYADEVFDPNMRFEMRPARNSTGVICSAPGFGLIGNYGNGSIMVCR